MNSRHKTLILLLLFIILIWKSFHYLSVNNIKVGVNEESILLAKLKQQDLADNIDKVVVTVYYEALCSDSRSFILRQLLPTYLQLSKYITLDLVPYGKAKTIENQDGKLDFKCQHGEIECLGNKVHACTIDQTKDDQLLQLQMVSCMIDDNIIPFDAAEKCAVRNNNNANYEAIADCTNSAHSSELLKSHGTRTSKIHPSFIPTVELNGTTNIPLAEILKDLKVQVCNSFSNKPKECLE